VPADRNVMEPREAIGWRGAVVLVAMSVLMRSINAWSMLRLPVLPVIVVQLSSVSLGSSEVYRPSKTSKRLWEQQVTALLLKQTVVRFPS
jgi:hypothetical protein